MELIAANFDENGSNIMFMAVSNSEEDALSFEAFWLDST